MMMQQTLLLHNSSLESVRVFRRFRTGGNHYVTLQFFPLALPGKALFPRLVYAFPSLALLPIRAKGPTFIVRALHL